MAVKLDFSTSSIQTSDGTKNHPLPKEIWFHILSYISPRSELRHVVSAALTCKSFYGHFFPFFQFKADILKGMSQLCRLTRTSKSPFTEFVESERNYGDVTHFKFLATSSDGKQFFSSEWGVQKHILVIVEFSTKLNQFVVRKIDVQDAIKNIPNLNTDFYEHNANKISTVHPIDDGFLVVTAVGVSRWRDGTDGPECMGFFSPFSKIKFSSCIYGSAFVDGLFYLDYHEKKRVLSSINFQKDKPDFSLVDSHVESFDFIAEFDGRLFFYTFNKEEDVYHFNRISIKNNQIVSSFKSFSLNLPAICAYKNWVLFESNGYLQIYDVEKNQMAIGPEWKIKECQSPLISGYPVELASIKDDFLIISYQKDFRAIYLPAKKEYTEKLRPLLAPYFADHDLTIFSFAFSKDKDNKSVLSVLFLKDKIVDAGKQQYLLEVKFHLEDYPEQKNDLSVDELEKETPSTNHVVLEIQKQKTVSSSLLHGKTILVAASFFALLTIGLSLTLRTWANTSVIHFGSGIHLTSAELAALAGGSATLILLALGSFRFWKEKSENRLINGKIM